MSHKTFHHLAIAIGLTVAVASIKLSSQAQAIPPGSPTRQQDHAALMTRQDAYWLGRTSLTRFWQFRLKSN